MVQDPSRPRRTGTYLEKDLSGEYLFYDREGDRVHVLNGTAREIYLLCDGTRTVAVIAGALRERFDVDEATALRDSASTIAALVEQGLLQV